MSYASPVMHSSFLCVVARLFQVVAAAAKLVLCFVVLRSIHSD